jgi:hypothetical protein
MICRSFEEMRKRKGTEVTRVAVTIKSDTLTSYYGKWPDSYFKVPGDIDTFNTAFGEWLAKYTRSKTVRLSSSPVRQLLKKVEEENET